MDTTKLKKFAQFARRSLIEQVSAKLEMVLHQSSMARRESATAIAKLEQAIINHGKEHVIERVAYTWFNRFCALRFMDVNRYVNIGVVSPIEGQFQPEILAEAKQGVIDQSLVDDKVQQQVFALLNGKAPSNNPQGEAYCLLVTAVCNSWNKSMPFLFERINGYTELLMPDDLLSGNSILTYTREAMTPEACKDVEVIGWLYQYYISEKKDEVFADLKKNKKITPDNIPAATQLFTPHWIVRYLVENSLGRLWMLNRPQSKLYQQMEYYIKPETSETDFLQIKSPEDIKICDPACGSGHMLTYAFDLLYAMYEEDGYDSSEIPEKILSCNLYGIEIDTRAGNLAAFALTMKACAKQRRFFRKRIVPNICVLENVTFDENELNSYMNFVGRALFTKPIAETLHQFEEVSNFGSLIRPAADNVADIIKNLEEKNVSGHLLYTPIHKDVLKVLHQADYLSPKYHVVIANPPYMGGKNMNTRLGAWLKDNYGDVKSDLFSAFIIRNTELALPKGQLGFMTPFVWMFISSYEKLRNFLINQKTITSLIQLEYSGFDGATVPICTFTLDNSYKPVFKGGYVRLSDFRGSENQAPKTLEAIKNPNCGWFFRASAEDFKKIPGRPIAYWVSERGFEIFNDNPNLADVAEGRVGLQTGDTNRFLRYWYEVFFNGIGFNYNSCDETQISNLTWYPYNKGGEYRKWYGNQDFIVNWKHDGKELRNFYDDNGKQRSVIRNPSYYFKEAISWSDVTSSANAFRYFQKGFIHDVAAHSAFNGNYDWKLGLMAYCNNRYVSKIVKILNPTMHFSIGYFNNIPYLKKAWHNKNIDNARNLISISKSDWDSYETSWDFTTLPLLQAEYHQPNLEATYKKLRAHWQGMTSDMHTLEEENNRIFIDAYGLQEEMTPEVPLKEITLTCNPHYRYDAKKTEAELEILLRTDTVCELISYAVGCMFGRYALEKPGLILANQGETLENYLTQIPNPSFPADADNVIPMLDGDWFTDDIVERFRNFVKVAFGEEHYEANLTFIENALGKNGKARSIRDYFLKDFYNDHLKRYKKRPIYWLFSSPKGSFNALIYMHRYRPDTVSVILNDYIREFNAKLNSSKKHLEAVSISSTASPADKTKADKEIEKVRKMLIEIEAYEHDVLYPLATKQMNIDLDDGVKVNYLQFGTALKKIPGLDAKED